MSQPKKSGLRCPVKDCLRLKERDGDLCDYHQKQWDDAVRVLSGTKP